MSLSLRFLAVGYLQDLHSEPYCIKLKLYKLERDSVATIQAQDETVPDVLCPCTLSWFEIKCLIGEGGYMVYLKRPAKVKASQEKLSFLKCWWHLLLLCTLHLSC